MRQTAGARRPRPPGFGSEDDDHPIGNRERRAGPRRRPACCRCCSPRRRRTAPANTLTAAERAAGMAAALRRPVARRVARLQVRRGAAGMAGRRRRRCARTRRWPTSSRADQFGDFELELDWKIGDGRQQRHLLPRHRGGRATSTGRRRSTSCSTTSAARTTRRGSPAPARPTRSTRRRPGTSSRSASGTAPASSPAARTSSTGSTAPSCSSTSCGAPTGKRRSPASKFGKWPRFGRATRGHIAMQGDHAGPLAFRNIRIRELPQRRAVFEARFEAASGGAERRATSRAVTRPGNGRRAWPAPPADTRSSRPRRDCPGTAGRPCPSGWSRTRWP